MRKTFSGEVGVTGEEWRTFRAILVKQGKTVKGVFTGYVRNYIKRERRELEKTGKVELQKAEGKENVITGKGG